MRQIATSISFAFKRDRRKKLLLLFAFTSGFLFLLILLSGREHEGNLFNHLQLRPEIDWSHLYNLSASDRAMFFEYKTREYSHRRDRVAKYCRWLKAKKEKSESYDLMMNVKKNSISYDAKDKVAYCQIAKVGSSTWCRHFIALADPSPAKVAHWSNALQLFAPHLWPLPEEGTPEKLLPTLLAEKDFVSLVMVRNPFSRLVSIFFQKLIDQSKGYYGHFNRMLIVQFRPEEEVVRQKKEGRSRKFEPPWSDPIYPSPEEFVRFLIHELSSRSLYDADQHWLPQHAACPFCLTNFTIYGRLEDMHEDAAFFFLRTELVSRVADPSLNYNPSLSGGGEKEKEFWKRVGRDFVYELYGVYRIDFEMFGYSVREYFEDIGLPDKVGEDIEEDSLVDE